MLVLRLKGSGRMYKLTNNVSKLSISIFASVLLFAAPVQGQVTITNNTHTVLPDVATVVPLSNRDINRVVCLDGVVDGFQFSEEKGAVVAKTGSQAFVKFQVKQVGSQTNYVKVRNEFYFHCSGTTYSLIGDPQNVVAQTIYLAPGSGVKNNINEQLFSPLSEEERAVRMTMGMLQDKIPASFSIKENNSPYAHMAHPNVDIRVRREIRADGTSYRAKEFLLRARQRVELDETMFASTAFGSSIFAITLDRLVLNAGEIGRLFIVYKGDE